MTRRFSGILVFTVLLVIVALLMALGQSNNHLTLLSSSDTIGSGHYDSLQFPRGTDFVAPIDQSVVLTDFLTSPANVADPLVTVLIGYADSAVHDSASAPTNPVTVATQSWPAGSIVTGAPFSSWVPIPSGKFPWVKINGDFNFQATGVFQ